MKRSTPTHFANLRVCKTIKHVDVSVLPALKRNTTDLSNTSTTRNLSLEPPRKNVFDPTIDVARKFEN